MYRLFQWLLLLLWLMVSPLLAEEQAEADKHKDWVRANYSKFEYRIPMRDGTKLFTTVYRPNWSRGKFPIVLMRTPYSAGPYGASHYRGLLGPYPAFDKEGSVTAGNARPMSRYQTAQTYFRNRIKIPFEEPQS